MWLKFTNEIECINCIGEIDSRLSFDGNVTMTFAKYKQDIDGNFVIPKPKQSILSKIEFLVRPKTIDTIDENNNPIQIETIEKVVREFDEQFNDITVYDGTEYVFTKQDDLSNLFTYQEVETVSLIIDTEA